jgi:Uma2 family endonuclease
MSSESKPKLTEAEYLAIERKAETKSEFFRGEMFALAGTSPRHNVIAGNIFAALHAQLRGSPCRAYFSDLRAKAGHAGLYTYPDIVVVCGDARFEDAELDTLLNPKLIVEVLSPTTEGYDRGKKFEMYRTIESFTEYVLISQDRVHVERHVKLADASWRMTETAERGAVIELETGPCRLSVADVYEGAGVEA